MCIHPKTYAAAAAAAAPLSYPALVCWCVCVHGCLLSRAYGHDMCAFIVPLYRHRKQAQPPKSVRVDSILIAGAYERFLDHCLTLDSGLDAFCRSSPWKSHSRRCGASCGPGPPPLWALGICVAASTTAQPGMNLTDRFIRFLANKPAVSHQLFCTFP